MSGLGWPTGDSVVLLPSGRTIRGRALRRSCQLDAPDFGVYLTGRQPASIDWDHEWIPWRDFWLPSNRSACIESLANALRKSGLQRVEVGCHGGLGRTGTAIGVMAVLDGIGPDDVVTWVRTNYHPKAIETPWQRRWLRTLRP